MINKRLVKFAFAFIFAFIALAVPRSAFAYEYTAYTIFQNEWYEDGDIDPTQGWIIYANSKYDAALYVCGDNVSNLTDEQLNYLSDPNYGGAFYSLAQSFGTGFEHAWIPDYVRPMLALVDFDKVQVGTATTYEISQAKARLQEVMNGDYGGGGSGGGSGDTSGTITSSYALGNGRGIYMTSTSGGQLPASETTVILNITGNVQASLSQVMRNYPYYVFVLTKSKWNANDNFSYGYVLYSTTPFTVSDVSNINSNNLWVYNTSSFYQQALRLSTGTFPATNATALSTLNYIQNGSDGVGFTNSGSNASWYYMSHEGSGTPTPPEGDWPSAPVEPTPPELPTPTSPTVPVEPEPTIPDPTIPSDPIYIPVEAPDSTDYTDWLCAILSALNNIDSEIVTLSTNLGDYFAAVNQYLVRLIQDIANHCQHLQTAMNTEFTSLKNYLNQLFTWLSEQMQFNFEGFDDSSIINWLRKIYMNMGGGTFKPNPQADPTNFLDWLADLWHRFLLDLMAVLPDSLGNLLEGFSQLTHYFPFSIPWDIAALLGLFAHTPITPVFDVPVPFAAGDSGTVMVHVDCSSWDDVAAMIRPCFLAIFCLQLALLTRDLLKGLNLNEGGL